MNPDRLWRRFVVLALLCAVLPGFGLAALMTGTLAVGRPVGLWYAAAIQAHATALLMGWGGGMILGVALHFLPRLRGVKLAHPKWVPVLFWLLAGGLALRVVGQPLLTFFDPIQPSMAALGWRDAVAAGVLMQALATGGLLAVLIATFRAGPPLERNKGFKQIAPLLTVAAVALIGAQLAWCFGAVNRLGQGASLAIFPMATQEMAVDLLLFGFIIAVSIAMSSRLFPLTFWMQLPQPRGLVIAAGLLAVGVTLTILNRLPLKAAGSSALAGLAALCYAAGIFQGAWAVRVLHARKRISNTQTPHRIWEDPAAVGVFFAYVWAVIAALFLLLFALQQTGMAVGVHLDAKSLARHAAGAGFMTLLIISVGWKMLPGFGGSRPQGRGWMWAAVLLANAAALLRILPVLLPGGPAPGQSWSVICFPFAGLTGLASILAFAIALKISLRKPAK